MGRMDRSGKSRTPLDLLRNSICPLKPTLFPLIFIVSPHRPIQVASSMRFEQQTALKIREKIVDFFGQSELRKRSIFYPVLFGLRTTLSILSFFFIDFADVRIVRHFWINCAAIGAPCLPAVPKRK